MMFDPEKTVYDLAGKVVDMAADAKGFVIGLSGTDSIVAFYILYHAAATLHIPVWGIHYETYRSSTERERAKKYGAGWFVDQVIPWLRTEFKQATIEIAHPLGANEDQQRWADLALRSVKTITPHGEKIITKDHEEQYWVSGTINATEWELGKYSTFANAVSIQPIISIWKNEILEICKWLDVPQIAIENSQVPDCLCGRDELAANNILLLDRLIRGEEVEDSETADLLRDYIVREKATNAFKRNIPYRV